jgi:hypothetical protein
MFEVPACLLLTPAPALSTAASRESAAAISGPGESTTEVTT